MRHLTGGTKGHAHEHLFKPRGLKKNRGEQYNDGRLSGPTVGKRRQKNERQQRRRRRGRVAMSDAMAGRQPSVVDDMHGGRLAPWDSVRAGMCSLAVNGAFEQEDY